MTSWDDETLMAELRAAVREHDDVAASAREEARAAFAWRTIDEELLLLTHDSLQDAGATVRSARTAGTRVLSFQGSAFSLELELDEDRWTGQVVPGRVCGVTLTSSEVGASRGVEADEFGFFSLDALPGARARFTVVDATAAYTTEWFSV